MQKAFLVSILLANVAIPVWAARDRNASRGLKKAVAGMLLFDALYMLGLMYLYPRL